MYVVIEADNQDGWNSRPVLITDDWEKAKGFTLSPTAIIFRITPEAIKNDPPWYTHYTTSLDW